MPLALVGGIWSDWVLYVYCGGAILVAIVQLIYGYMYRAKHGQSSSLTGSPAFLVVAIFFGLIPPLVVLIGAIYGLFRTLEWVDVRVLKAFQKRVRFEGPEKIEEEPSRFTGFPDSLRVFETESKTPVEKSRALEVKNPVPQQPPECSGPAVWDRLLEKD